MIWPLKKFALWFLRWSLGLVVLWQSWQTFHLALAKPPLAGHPLAHVRLGLSGVEMVAGILFLIPFTSLVGGVLLLIVFALAVLLHILHGDAAGWETLLVYAAAVLVCLAERRGPFRLSAG